MRNPGGRVKHSLNDILGLDMLAQLQEIMIIHHTGQCSRRRLDKRVPNANLFADEIAVRLQSQTNRSVSIMWGSGHRLKKWLT